MIYSWKNLKFKTSNENVGSFYSICIQGAYDTILSDLRHEDVVIDGGANIGVFSILASRIAKKVISVEPSRSNFVMLQHNITLNNAKNVIPINAALTDKEGLVGFEGNGEVGHISDSGTEIRSTTIDSLALNEVSVLKLDIEGAEPLALLKQRSLGHIRTIVFELDMTQYLKITNSLSGYPEAYTYESLLNVLQSNGFHLIMNPDNGALPWKRMLSRQAMAAEFKSGFLGFRYLVKRLFIRAQPQDRFSMVFAFRK